MHLLINIDVPDLPPAIDFYCTALGLRFNRIIDGDVAELLGASSRIYLLKRDAGSATTTTSTLQRQYARHWTAVHLDFVVDDLAVAAKRALEAGANQESDCVEWMGSACITFSDPFGHGFCLIELDNETYSADADQYQYKPVS